MRSKGLEGCQKEKMTQGSMSTAEQPRKWMKLLHQSLTVINHADIQDTSPAVDNYLLDLHQPDPVVPPCEQVWPSSDVDQTDTPHDDSDVSHDLDNEMLGVQDIDLDVVDGSGDQVLQKSNVKVKGRRGPGD